MKNYQEIYEKIENPLNDDEVVRKLIEGYSDELGTKKYYKKLTEVYHDQKKYTGINVKDKDKFVSEIFNEWKKDITRNISDEDIKSYNNQNFARLRECIKDIPDIKDFKENLKVFNRLNKLDKLDKDSKKTELTKIYKDYAAFFPEGTWTYITYNNINPSKYKNFIVDHRLYLNTENIDTYKVMELFRNKCKERELNYLFKFAEKGDRDDTIVIYSDDRKLSKYLEILEEIKKEEPEIVKRAQTPPMLTGKIDGWIGYGSEPPLDENGKNTNSFNNVRSGIIQNAISKETIKWIRENKELRKEDLGLNEYLTKQIYDDIKDKYRMYKTVHEDQFQEKLLKRLEKEIEKNKSELLEGKFDKIKEFNIDGINIEVDSQMIQRAFRPFSKKILKKDPSFLGKVRDAIKEEGLANGIDPEKFCFDIDKRDKLFNEDKTNEILETIDPEFLNKKIKFVGFVKGHDEIEYERYIRAVVKELPKDKNIIMKDGRQLTPKQFIENEIPKLEQKYNINIKKLLEENIVIEKEEKINKNKNSIEQRFTTPDNSKNEQYNVDILKNINKDVLNKKVQIDGGKEITYKEYLEKYVMPKMPKEEKIKLKNGIEMPTKQYIEEVLLQEKSKYGLNVDSMLADTIMDYAKKENEKNKNNIEQRFTTPDNSKNEQYNVDILKNINKDVLNKKVQIDGGKEITYKEYLEKYVMPKMPKEEKIKLKNGIEMPTKQYIEEVLLQEKSKYGLNVDSMLADTIMDYAKKENEKIKSINTNNIRNNVNGMDFKDNVIEEARISYDSFKDNTDKEQVEKQKIQKVLLETEKTNLPMKIGFFEKIKQSFKKIKEIAHKVKEWIDKKKDSFFRENTKLVDIDLEDLEKSEKSETKDNSNKVEEKETQDSMNYKKITNSEILENEAVKEKIEEYMKNLNNKVENSNSSKKKEKDLEI